FEKLKELPAKVAKDDDFDASFDDAFSEAKEEKKDENKGDFKSIGGSERRVYGLIATGRDVRKLVDLSGLGEFETCKALFNLVNLEYLRAIQPTGRAASAGGAGVFVRVGGMVARGVVTMMVLAALGFVGSRLKPDTWDLGDESASSYADPATQRLVARAQQARIEAALEVFRLEKGALPERLEALVEVGLLQREDLRYPWRDDYYYRRTSDRQFILLPPLR
ncbi:MAG TPA: response regulator, partial [Archangium sp.]